MMLVARCQRTGSKEQRLLEQVGFECLHFAILYLRIPAKRLIKTQEVGARGPSKRLFKHSLQQAFGFLFVKQSS